MKIFLQLLLQKLDNEAPAGLKTFMRYEAFHLQLVTPYLHHRNDVERYQSTYAALKIANAFLNPSPEAPFATVGYAQLYVLYQLSELFQTAAPVRIMPTSPTPKLTIKLPKVPIM